MDRRVFVAGAASAAALVLAGCSDGPFLVKVPHTPATAGPTTTPIVHAPTPSPTPTPTPTAPPTPSLPVFPTPAPGSIPSAAFPPAGTVITSLPIPGDFMAWTVDDGANADVVRAYAEMAAATGVRLTFFANGMYPGWAAAADVLRPLVQSGQVVIGNHTFHHTALTKLSDQGIIDELQQNDTYLTNLFGVSPKPFYRPPYGYRNAHTDRVAASIGYTVPVMWYGSLSDSGLITTDQEVQFATQWFLPGHVVIGHANFPPVTQVFPQLLGLLQQRGLQTVTMRDVFH